MPPCPPVATAPVPSLEQSIPSVPNPLPLRAHMALCLLGFRGSGYSPEFVVQMQAIQDTLRANPDHEVALIDWEDSICGACPHLVQQHGCTLGGPDHEEHMAAHDREVLRRLALMPNVRLPWSELLARIGGAIRGADLDAICTTCPWLPLGVCRQSVDALSPPPPEVH